jgi:hypothetical protein
MQKKIFYALLLIIMILGCLNQAEQETTKNNYEGKKVLFINSYHSGYEWSDGVQRGAEGVLNKTAVDLVVYYMDTKNNPSEDFSRKAALEAKSVIEDFEPDVVITSDDNAFKYIIMPYYKDAELPVVFCALNWDASVYGAPYKNTAGMVEVALIKQLLNHMKQYTEGDKVAFITADVLSEKKNAEHFDKLIEGGLSENVFVKNFSEWKEEYLRLQDDADMLILGVSAGIDGWDDGEAKEFVLKNTKIPAGVEARWMMDFALIGLTKIPEEQGEWAAKTALKIIDGESPSNIPITENKKGELYLNIKVAEKLGIVFDPFMVKNADKVVGG